MSRIGRLPILLPDQVEIQLEGNHVKVKGPKGELERSLPAQVNVSIGDREVRVERPTDSRIHRSMHGLTRTLLSNMVVGVTQGFARDLELVGVGYRATKQGDDLVLTLGFSHPVRYSPPAGITFEVPEPTKISVRGCERELVGQVSAELRRHRPPEPYKGKGVLYAGEKVRRKAGKAAK